VSNSLDFVLPDEKWEEILCIFKRIFLLLYPIYIYGASAEEVNDGFHEGCQEAAVVLFFKLLATISSSLLLLVELQEASYT
jgi:hypothetical protein